MQGCEVHITIEDERQITKFYKDDICVGIHIKHITFLYEFWWNGKTQYHSFDDKPAIVMYHKDKTLLCHMWYNNGKKHRDNGPALLDYENGQIIEIEWCKNGKSHCETGPARIYLSKNGVIKNKWYIYDDRLQYKDVPEISRLPASLRAAMLVLPLPIGDEILHQCEWLWPFE